MFFPQYTFGSLSLVVVELILTIEKTKSRRTDYNIEASFTCFAGHLLLLLLLLLLQMSWITVLPSHSCGGTLQTSRSKTVAQLNADVC